MKKPAPINLTRLSWGIKIAIVIAAVFYIGQKIILHKGLLHFSDLLESALKLHTGIFLCAFLLLFVNWGLEAWKWKMLLVKLVPVSYPEAYKAVLAGVTTGIFTPNRAGEFGGRVFSLPQGHRVEAALLSGAGGLAQFCITILAALPVTLTQTHIRFFLPLDLRLARIGGIVILFLILVLFLFRRLWLPSARKYLPVFRLHGWRYWLGIVLISGLRYLVFSFQFYLLLRTFGIHLSVVQAYVGIAMTFFSTTVIPTLAFSEIGVRGGAALVFVGLFSDNALGILSASILLWILNIALPALVGAVFVLKLNPFKKSISS